MNRANISPVNLDNTPSKFIAKQKGERSELASEAALHFPPPVFVLIDIAFRLSALLCSALLCFALLCSALLCFSSSFALYLSLYLFFVILFAKQTKTEEEKKINYSDN